MLTELHVRQLGVVEDLSLVFGEGMTAVTGETGAGKTLLIEAIRLLTGGRAEPQMVRSGAEEATVEGRFVDGDEEFVLTRVVPTDGRSRAYVDGRMVSLAQLSEIGERLVDLHGQHAHQALLSGVAQRDGLDAFGVIDVSKVKDAKQKLSDIDAQITSLGGDAQTRAREVDLLRFQLDELEEAELEDPKEDEHLRASTELLADAGAHREAAGSVHAAISETATEAIAAALKAAGDRVPLQEVTKRLQALQAEIDDLTLETAQMVDTLQDDPARLAEMQERRHLLKQLQRKYGPELANVIAYRDETRTRLNDLERHDEVIAELEKKRAAHVAELEKAQAALLADRRKAAPKLAKKVEARLRELALPHARFAIEVEGQEGENVSFLLGPNPGQPLLPVAKAASGGELARSMLALRLSLLGTNKNTPKTLVFDEVDAGIGGEAAITVGNALHALTRDGSQTFVVTHLPQVAASADHQITVRKEQQKSSTSTHVQVLDLTEREIELARMLSGRPDSDSGRAHARELLDGVTGRTSK